MPKGWTFHGEKPELGGMYVRGADAVRVTPTHLAGRQKNAWFIGVGTLEGNVFWPKEIVVVQIGPDDYSNGWVEPTVRLNARVKLGDHITRRWLK